MELQIKSEPDIDTSFKSEPQSPPPIKQIRSNILIPHLLKWNQDDNELISFKDQSQYHQHMLNLTKIQHNPQLDQKFYERALSIKRKTLLTTNLNLYQPSTPQPDGHHERAIDPAQLIPVDLYQEEETEVNEASQYEEFCKLSICNMVMEMQIKKLIDERKEMRDKITRLEIWKIKWKEEEERRKKEKEQMLEENENMMKEMIGTEFVNISDKAMNLMNEIKEKYDPMMQPNQLQKSHNPRPEGSFFSSILQNMLLEQEENPFEESKKPQDSKIQSEIRKIKQELENNSKRESFKLPKRKHKSSQDSDKKKRHRRTASQIERHFQCPECSKSYGSEGSLNQHLKIKHAQSYKKGELKSGGTKRKK